MKKSTLVLTIAFISLTAFAQKSNIEKDIKMYTQVWDEVINKGDINQINATHFDENITGVSSPENIVGIAAFKGYYQNFLTGFSDRNFEIINVFGQNDNIMKHWRFTGKHTGDFFGIPPTGKSVNIEGVTLVKMKNGRILQEQDFMDNSIFLQQLGLTSDPNNLTIIDNLYKAFAIGDIPTVLGGMDAKIVWNEAEGNSYADGNPYIGPDAVLNGVFARVGGEWENFKLNNIELHEMSNNKVLATLRYTGKYKKTGKSIDVQVAHFWTLKDGKVTAFQQYVDTKQLADAEGKL
ncbi:MAG: ester cyclase [Aequorivita sp.]|nr:ester cyclase [Aequorivita sp.]